MRTGTVAQALLRAVAGQLIQASRARQIERTIVRATTPELGGLHAPPTCAELGALLTGASSRGSGSARGGQAALIRLCRALELERLKTLPTASVVARLTRERGLGPWSVGLVCLEGLGRYEYGLYRDLGLAKLASALWGRWVEAEESDELLAPYGEWSGLASVYLLAGLRARFHTLALLQPDLHIVDDPAAAVGELLADAGAARRLDRPHRRLDRRRMPTGAPRRSSPTGARVTLWWGDERCVPPDDERSNYRLAKETLLDQLEPPPREIHRIRGESPPAEAADELDAALAGVHARLPAARPRPRRAHGLALPRLAAARRHRPARDRRPGRARAVGRPRDDDGADDPVGEAGSSSSSPAPTRPTPSRARSAARSPRTCPRASPGSPRFRSRSS